MINHAADNIHSILNDLELKETHENEFKVIIEEAKEYGTFLKEE